ncbi:ATP-dependent DNA helicase PIF1 [Drechslerella dactyloides]|uniref:ATP-dependent DNA helicase n=1 Tax=Drechslerella dactyloides TaxID=74499 RepID=A0AAD6IPN2_DREDA|nr:ATP-dependent DNA helicase PIF1 [Drechslerella dactyloides]
MGKKQRFYAVVQGRTTGVFDQPWSIVRNYVDGYPGAIYKSFTTRGEATTWWVGKFRETANPVDVPTTNPIAKRSRTAGLGDEQEAPQGLEPVRPKKVPRQGKQSTGPTVSIEISSSPPSSPDSFVSAAENSDALLKSPTTSNNNTNRFTPQWSADQFTSYPALPTRKGPAAEREDRQTSTYQVQRPIEEPSIPLTPEQNVILQNVLRGENVFFTGPAGTGKSLVLEHIKYRLSLDHLAYAVTAPTGIAAVLIGGVTIHNFFGIGTGEHGIGYYLRRSGEVSSNIRQKLQETDVLIVDEISMVSPDLWEKINRIARYHRCGDDPKNQKPFGGLQVIACGDFFQLPPVERDDKKTCIWCGELFPPKPQRKYLKGKSFLTSLPPQNAAYFPDLIDDNKWLPCTGKNCQARMNDSVRYVFQSEAWQALDFKPLILEKVLRQTNEEWVGVLDNVKHSRLTPDVQRYLRNLTRPLPNLPNGIRPTKLYSHRADVEKENNAGLNQLPGEEYAFKALDGGWFVPRAQEENTMPDLTNNIPWHMIVGAPHNFYFNHLQAPKELKLKMDAQVMLVSNLDVQNQLVNGSRGIVKGFQRYTLEKLLETAKSEKHNRHILKIWFEARKTPEGYVNIPLVSFSPLLTAAAAASKAAEASRPGAPIPIFPVTWDTKMFVDESRAAFLRRIHLPLTLAWATTIHKSQGMTLDYTAVDIQRSFACGQSYVALSRCRTPEGLSVLLPPAGLARVIMTDPIVERFTRLLTGDEDGEQFDRPMDSQVKSEDVNCSDIPSTSGVNLKQEPTFQHSPRPSDINRSAANRPAFKQSLKQFKANSRLPSVDALKFENVPATGVYDGIGQGTREAKSHKSYGRNQGTKIDDAIVLD